MTIHWISLFTFLALSRAQDIPVPIAPVVPDSLPAEGSTGDGAKSLRDQIIRFGMVDDTLDPELMALWEKLRGRSSEIWPVLVELLESDEPASVHATAFSLMLESISTKRDDILNTAISILEKRDPVLFGSLSLLAMRTVSKYGSETQMGLMETLCHHDDLITRKAAILHLSQMKRRIAATSRAANESLIARKTDIEPAPFLPKGRNQSATVKENFHFWHWLAAALFLGFGAFLLTKRKA